MVHHLRIEPGNRPVVLRATPAALSLGLGRTTVYSFDRAGRLYASHEDGVGCRRSVTGQVLEIRSGVRGRTVRRLPEEEGDRQQERARQAVLDLLAALRAGRATGPGGARPGRDEVAAIAEILAAPAGFDREARRRDAGAFARAYPHPVAILPPDRSLSLVLQVTEGCPTNRCSFCDLYRDRPFRVRTAEEFHAHLLAVQAAFGEGLGLRRGIFLGDAGAVVVSREDLLPLLEQVRDLYADLLEVGDLASFVDVAGGLRKPADEWTELVGLGLGRVYLGLESGDERLLERLGKPMTPGDTLRLVERLRAAGIDVGVIVLAGLAGREEARRHVKATAALLDALELGPRDLIYLSPLVGRRGADRVRRNGGAEIRTAGETAIREQMEQIRARLSCLGRRDHPKVVPYDIRGFLY
jgi:hypothetical protein